MHSHRDANRFTLIAGGKQIFRDDGYKEKHTNYHNTLTINGVGQNGNIKIDTDDEVVPMATKSNNRRSFISSYQPSGSFVYAAGDATEAYKPNVGNNIVNKFKRHIAHVKGKMVVIIDEIKLNTNAYPKLWFHPNVTDINRIELNPDGRININNTAVSSG